MTVPSTPKNQPSGGGRGSRGGWDSLNGKSFLVSWFLGVWFLGLLVSWFLDCLVSWFLGLKTFNVFERYLVHITECQSHVFDKY